MPILLPGDPQPSPDAQAAARIRQVPQLLRSDRTANRLTRRAQARRIGISEESLIRLDSTTANPTQATLLAVLDYLAT